MTRWIRNLNFSTKLVVIAIAAMAPLIVLTLLFASEKQKSIDSNVRELSGLQRYRSLAAMLLPLGMHEVWSTAASSGDAMAVADKLQAATAEVTRAVTQQDANDNDYGAPAGEDARRWSEVKYSWNALATARSTSAAEIIRLHSQLRQRILDYRDYIANTSGLALDGDAIGSLIIDTAVLRIPNFESHLTEMRSRAAGVGAAGKPTLADMQQITRSEVLAQSALDEIDADIRRAAEDSTAGGTLRAGAEQSLSQVKNSFESISRYVHQIVSGGSGGAGGVGSGSDSPDEIVRNFSQLGAAIGGLHDAMQQAAQQRLQARLEELRGTRDRMLLLVAAAVLIGLGSLSIVIWTTVNGMNEAMTVVSRLADGDYTQQIPVHGSDELARTMLALQIMQGKLSGVLSSVRESSLTVATAARQINAGTSDLAVRTEQQAANLEETASSMEAMTTTVRQNADNARLADKLAQAARDQAERGGAMVERAVAAMGAIDVASRKIADIISVIDEIAFQTNLLALNAAVEAARAGDQGRGFAVVASEVRSLAQRSASAAREIKGLIHDSVGKVSEGSRLVCDSGQHLGEIVASVKKVSDVVGEISNACQEQAASAGQISHAVLQMDQSTQQNAAMVEQASAAAASMNDQAARLSQLTAFFRLRTGSHDVAAGAHRIAAPAAADTAAASDAPSATGKQQGAARGERRTGPRPWSKAVAAHAAGAAYAAGAAHDAAAAHDAPGAHAAGDGPSAMAAAGGDWSEF
jgi:methyl-accepting chemotaxis protein